LMRRTGQPGKEGEVDGLEREPGPETTAILRGVGGPRIPKMRDLSLVQMG
jgi:hypothetical protein